VLIVVGCVFAAALVGWLVRELIRRRSCRPPTGPSAGCSAWRAAC